MRDLDDGNMKISIDRRSFCARLVIGTKAVDRADPNHNANGAHDRKRWWQLGYVQPG